MTVFCDLLSGIEYAAVVINVLTRSWLKDNIEDVKSELAQLATFLNDGCFGENKSTDQRNLVIELTIMKLRDMSKE